MSSPQWTHAFESDDETGSPSRLFCSLLLRIAYYALRITYYVLRITSFHATTHTLLTINRLNLIKIMFALLTFKKFNHHHIFTCSSNLVWTFLYFFLLIKVSNSRLSIYIDGKVNTSNCAITYLDIPCIWLASFSIYIDHRGIFIISHVHVYFLFWKSKIQNWKLIGNLEKIEIFVSLLFAWFSFLNVRCDRNNIIVCLVHCIM